MKDVSVVYVNYKTKEITLNSIKSVVEKTEGIDYEIILVDNNSGDGVIDEVNKLFPQVIAVQSGENLGFAGGCNLGARHASGRYILFLNTDTVLVENSLKVMHEFMERNPEYAVIGAILVDEEDRVVRSWGKFLPFVAGTKEFILKPFLPKCLKKRAEVTGEKYETFASRFFRGKDVKEVDYVIGADMFIRRDVFDKFGGFDERFFMFFEEADFQIGVRRKGYKIGIIRNTRIVHLESKSFKTSNAKRTMKMVSFLKYLRKNFPAYYLVFKPLSLIYGLLKLSADLLTKEYSLKENIVFIKSILLETFDLVKN